MAIGSESASGATDVTITSGPARLLGWSVIESDITPAAASIVIRDGTSTAGSAVAVVKLAASGTHSEWLGPQGVLCKNGIYLDRTSGTTTVVVYWE